MNLNISEKHHFNNIFEKFIKPHFSILKFIIFFEWDYIARNYRYVVMPKGDKNKFISFYLHKHEKIDDFEMVIIYTAIGEFNLYNTQKLLFLLSYDDLERFNQFYQDFIHDLEEKSFKESPVDFYIPFSIKR